MHENLACVWCSKSVVMIIYVWTLFHVHGLSTIYILLCGIICVLGLSRKIFAFTSVFTSYMHEIVYSY